jgi:alpha,alpha-trehalase
MTDSALFRIESLSPLYEAVQRSGIFADSKYFPDCTPKSAAADILQAYEQARSRADFDLKKFVETHFLPPQAFENQYYSEQKPISQHLQDLWGVLLRKPDEGAQVSTLLPLPHPYIVPGGRFGEVYYWDSYFTMLGLRESGRADLIEHMVDNFAHLIETVGHIPNGNRSYYLSRSQPPFFAPMVGLLAEVKGEAILLRYRRALEKEHAFWMAGENELGTAHSRLLRMPDGSVLNRYWDDDPTPRPEAYIEDQHLAAESGREASEVYRHIRAAAESGWDFSSRWFADGQNMATIETTDLVPVDLNCLLYTLEKTLVHAYRQLPDHVPVEVFRDRARRRKNAIQQHLWDGAAGFFFDFNQPDNQRTTQWTLAAAFPLFCQIAEAEQAAQVAAHLEAKFLGAGGLSTTLTHSGQQWDAPNGWAPLQWVAVQGLRNYGYNALAEEIRQRWLALNERTYAETGKMMEKYNVMDTKALAGGGEYPNQDGFGWTNGVYLKMKSLT